VDLSPLFLSRLQFALTIGFHFLFPPISIGLAWLLVVLEWRGWRGDEAARRAGRFFGRILGITFAVGVASGIVMEFQFGTNWAEYAKFVGDIFGAPLAAEAVFSFFLESAFIGLYLFGRDRLSPGAHWFSILMVAVGATLSAFWILVANSWQQTPAGFVLAGGRAELTSFWAAVFNPSTHHRFFHTMAASLVCGAFLMAGIAAWRLARDRGEEAARTSLRLALVVGLVFAVASLFPTGHHSAVQVARTQPEKLATIEGLIDGQAGAPLVIFGVPHVDPPRLTHVVQLPGLLSWLAAGDTEAWVDGMNDLRAAGWPTPPFAVTFVSFHLMVMLGMLFIAAAGLGVLLMLLRRLEGARWYLRLLPWLLPLPLVATQLGWIVAEVGRQPWVVYRILKTRDAFSQNVTSGEILFSLVLFGLVYLALGILYIWLLARTVRRGPGPLPVKEVG